MPYYDVALETFPKLTPEQLKTYFEADYRKATLELMAVCAIGISGWEHLLLMPAELRTWRLLWNGQWMPVRVLVLLARYTVIVASIMTCLLLFGRPDHCRGVFVGIYVLYTILWASCAGIFLIRLSIIYDSDRQVVLGFSILLAACVAVWAVVIAEGYRSVDIPIELQVPPSPRCAPGRIPEWCAVSWAASALYDAAVLLATWIALQRYKKSSSRKSLRTRNWVWNSNLIFFSVSIAFNVLCLVVELSVQDAFFKHLPVPVSFVMHVVVASRLVLASKGWTSGALAEEEWELDGPTADPPGKGSVLPGAGGPRCPRSPFLPSQSIQFDVTVEERVEYRPDLATVSKALAETARRSPPTSGHRTSSQRSHPDGRRASRANEDEGSITTQQTFARIPSLQVDTQGISSSSSAPLTPAATTPRSTAAGMHRGDSTTSLTVKRLEASFHSGMSNNNSVSDSREDEGQASPCSSKRGLRSCNNRPRSEPRQGAGEENAGNAPRPYSATSPREARQLTSIGHVESQT